MWAQSINFGGGLGLATVVTDATTNVAATTLTANGTVSDVGPGNYPEVDEVGFYIGTNANYASNTRHVVNNGQGVGSFSYNATGLTGSTQYYITAFAVGNGGESRGITIAETTGTSSFPIYTAGQQSGWTFAVCNCGSANGYGTLGGSNMEIYAPWWGGTYASTTTSIDLTNYSYIEVDYTWGGMSYASLSVGTGTTYQTLMYWYTVNVASGSQIAISESSPAAVTLSLSNGNNARAYITRIEAYP
tara:strand:+ start:41 stop:778 length:738 start_codon:yes stop_codon:yes gene_type:complete